MAIAQLIARGIGFSPGSVKFMPTLGLTPTVSQEVFVPVPYRSLRGNAQIGYQTAIGEAQLTYRGIRGVTQETYR